MALIVTGKDLTNTIDILHRITRAMENGRIPDWEKIGTNYFRNTKAELRNQACFRPTIKEDRLYFGLVNPDHPPFSVTRATYEKYHSMFYGILVHLSWQLYFTVEQTPDGLKDVDADIAD